MAVRAWVALSGVSWVVPPRRTRKEFSPDAPMFWIDTSFRPPVLGALTHLGCADGVVVLHLDHRAAGEVHAQVESPDREPHQDGEVQQREM